MNPFRAYQQQATLGWTRIDMLLALYDAVISKLEEGVEALQGENPENARPLLARAKILVGGLVAGVNPEGGPTALNILRLYEFALHCLDVGTLEKVEGALKVLRTLQEGFQAIRNEAVQLERSGQLPGVDATVTMQTVA